MANIELIAELQAVHDAGAAAWKGLSSVSPKVRIMLRKAEYISYPSVPRLGIDNNIVALSQTAINQLTANNW